MAWNFLVQLLVYIGTYTISALLNKGKGQGATLPPEIQFPKAESDAPIPVIYGTTRVGLNVVHKVRVQMGENTVRGSAPFGWSPQHIGYFYYIDALAIVGWGTLASLHDVIVDGTKSLKTIGTVKQLDSFGPLGLTFAGVPTVYPALPDQINNASGGYVFTITAGDILGGKFGRGGVGAGSPDAASAGVMRVYVGNGKPDHNAAFETLFGGDLPTYPNLIAVAFESFYMGNSETLPSIELVLTRLPPGASTLMGNTLSNSGRDANPGPILYDLLHNADYGLGLPESDLDGAAFGTLNSACDTYYGGPFDMGVSFVLSEQRTAKDIISDLLRTLDGVLYLHPETGLFTPYLMRDPSDPHYGYPSPIIVDESDILDGTLVWSESAADATVNEVKVEFIDPTRNYTKNVTTVRDVAAIHALGRTESRTVSFLGVQNMDLATRLAQRELKALSAVLGKGSLELKRSGYVYTPGSRFTLTHALIPGGSVVVRVVSVRDTAHGSVALDVVQDVYSTGSTPAFTVVPTPDVPTDPLYIQPYVESQFDFQPGDGWANEILYVYDPQSRVTAVEFTEDMLVSPSWHAAVNPPGYGTYSPYVNYIAQQLLSVTTTGGWRVTYTDANGDTQYLYGTFPTVPGLVTIPPPVLRYEVSAGTVTVTASWADSLTPDLYLYADASAFQTYTPGDSPVTSPYQISFAYPAPGDVMYVSAVRKYTGGNGESDYAYLTIVGAPTGSGGATGGGAAPYDADFLVKTASSGLSAERVVTDTTTIETDWSTAGQAKIKIVSSAPLPGSPTTTTQSPGDNSTKVATTAYVDAATAGAGAPSSADYLVKTANGSLSAERVVTDTSDITWDWTTGGQAKAGFTVDMATQAELNAAVLAAAGASGSLSSKEYFVRVTEDDRWLALATIPTSEVEVGTEFRAQRYLVGAGSVRFNANIKTRTGTPTVRLKYSADGFGSTIVLLSWTPAGTGLRTSGWVDLPSLAKADVGLTIYVADGADTAALDFYELDAEFLPAVVSGARVHTSAFAAAFD